MLTLVKTVSSGTGLPSGGCQAAQSVALASQGKWNAVPGSESKQGADPISDGLFEI